MRIPRVAVLMVTCFAVTFTLFIILQENSISENSMLKYIKPTKPSASNDFKQIDSKQIDSKQIESKKNCIKMNNSVLIELHAKLKKLEVENNRLVEIAHQFKNLSRQLATQIKEREGSSLPKYKNNLPWVFPITPTYTRITQKVDLVRLSQTLMHVTNLHWIIVEDSASRTNLVSRLLHESGLSYTHLNVPSPPKKSGHNHRGVLQRNLGLEWLRKNVDPKRQPGAVYFMDDDNTYHRKIFDEMRTTRRVSIWGVGFVAGYWEGPIVENGKIVRFHSGWVGGRPIPVDMAAFAVSLEYLLKEKKDVKFEMTSAPGFLESAFLQKLTTPSQLEIKADNCSKIYVWHTKTSKPGNLRSPPQATDLSVEV